MEPNRRITFLLGPTALYTTINDLKFHHSAITQLILSNSQQSIRSIN